MAQLGHFRMFFFFVCHTQILVLTFLDLDGLAHLSHQKLNLQLWKFRKYWCSGSLGFAGFAKNWKNQIESHLNQCSGNTLNGIEILHQLVTIGIPVKHWASTGAGFSNHPQYHQRSNLSQEIRVFQADHSEVTLQGKFSLWTFGGKHVGYFNVDNVVYIRPQLWSSSPVQWWQLNARATRCSSRGKVQVLIDLCIRSLNFHLVGGLEHDFYFSILIGDVIIPTDEIIVFRGVGLKPSTSHMNLA
jgi:hypothetical protein